MWTLLKSRTWPDKAGERKETELGNLLRKSPSCGNNASRTGLRPFFMTEPGLAITGLESYMQRRQSVWHVHSSYVIYAGGEARAVSALKNFYACKYTEDCLHDSEFAFRTAHEHVGSAHVPSITVDEL